MTKWEWESELKRYLSRLSQAEQERAMGYYRELFADKAEAGMTETRIIEEFGNPADVAQEILSEYQYELRPPEGEAMPPKDRPSPSVEPEQPRDARAVNIGAGACENEREAEPPRKRGFFGFDVGEPRVWKPAAGQTVTDLRIQAEGKIDIVQGDECKIEYYESDYFRYQFTCDNGVLRMQFIELRSLPKLIFFGLSACGFDKLSVKVTLPRDGRYELDVETHNSRIRLTDGTFGAVLLSSKNALIYAERLSAEKFCVQTTNGAVSVKNVKAGESTLATKNGAVDAHDCSFAQLSAQTTNASVHVERVSVAGNLTATSTNGRVKLENVRAESADVFTTNAVVELSDVSAGAVQAGTTNGPVTVESLAGDDVTLKTTNGSVRGTIRGRKADYTVVTFNKMGDNNLPSGGEGAKKLNVSTKNGSIKMRFTEDQ